MTSYNVVLMQPLNYTHSMGLWDIGRLLYHSFHSLGRPSALRVNELDPKAVNVLLGYQFVTDNSLLKGCDAVIYQLEQLSAENGWFTSERLEFMRHVKEIWDYSSDNIDFLKDKGLTNLKLLPIGFHEALCTIPRTTQNVDVLFYGSINERRLKILNELRPHCRLAPIFDLYGSQRDAWISRSKIVLNLHYYQSMIMEQVRVSYLLNNGCCVVSEDSPNNPFPNMIAAVPYEQITQTCLSYLQNAAAREALAQRGMELFRQRPMVEYLRQVLEDE